MDIHSTKIIYLRNESNINEFRTPLIPIHVKKLVELGYTVYIQYSVHRIYSNNEYEKHGGIITNKEWHDEQFKNGLIIGLKDFKNIEYLEKHTHIYFSHSYKNQENSDNILSMFKKSDSTLYDFEYFTDEDNSRLVSFGFYAGIVGCILGLLQYQNKIINNKNISNLRPFESLSSIMSVINKYDYSNIKMCIIGVNNIKFKNGLCSNGVKYILNDLNIEYTTFGRQDNKRNLESFDIIFNCINLDINYNEIWFDDNINYYKYNLIVDISCDYSKPNNPIKIYNKNTTWNEPIYSYNNIVDIIAINNLPSLLPKESSEDFSCGFLNLLINKDYYKYWIKNKNIYTKIINNL